LDAAAKEVLGVVYTFAKSAEALGKQETIVS
jgi:hypothetical protein